MYTVNVMSKYVKNKILEQVMESLHSVWQIKYIKLQYTINDTDRSDQTQTVLLTAGNENAGKIYQTLRSRIRSE